MKDFTSFDTWDIAETVQSQYATSKRMRAVIDAFWQAINPKSDIDLLYRKLVNPRTAEGWGLDVWGRIVAIGRSFLAVDDDTPYFGFDPPEGVKNERLNSFNNAPFPIYPVISDEEYLVILKQRWIEGRLGAFSPSSINERLEHYRDLFLGSGAWKRMTDHFEAQKSRPMYVLDLTREIDLIEAWYANRFREMDAYFGIKESDTEDGVNTIKNEKIKENNDIYNLSGQRLNKPLKGINIVNGRKVAIM